MTTDTTERMAYLARRWCGCCVAVTVDNPEHAKDVGKLLSEWVRDGLTIERIPVKAVQQGDILKACWHCDQCRAEVPEIRHYKGRNYCRACWATEQSEGRIPGGARPYVRSRNTEVLA